MTSTVFVPTTTITSEWLNDVNTFIYERVVHVSQYGAVGDGVTDDYAAIVAAMAVAVAGGVELVFDGTKTYSINQLNWTITAGAKFRTNGASFICNNSTTSNTVWLTVADGCTIDSLTVTVPTAIRRDRLITIGSNCRIQSVTITSVDVQATVESADYGIRVVGNNTRIGSMYSTNYDRAITITDSTECSIGHIDIIGYVRGLYIDECSDLDIGRSHFRTASVNASYTAGHNGVLIANDTLNASHDITLTDFHIENAGEHAIRIGGALQQNNISLVRPHLNDCGGSGIKILGTDAITPTDRNGTIYIIDPICEDIGSGVLADNKSGILVMHADRVHITNPTVRKVNKTYSSYVCLRIVNTTNLSVVNPHFTDAQTDGIWVDGTQAGDNSSGLRIIGGVCSNNGQDGLRIPTGGQTYTTFTIDGLVLESNGRYGFNIAKGAGTITDFLLKVKVYNNTSGAGACDTANVYMDVFGLPGSTTLASILAGNGSTWHNQTTLNYMKAATWTAL